ncbi:MAG: hypothetical protein JWL62_1137 [Hyphomicrobiales bacterium]|nr:hypothetical protein [Hyphomicrobiales bacterium]
MRILDFDLDRYGPFTDKHLVFRPDAKLHIVYGHNEAGKSCSLAAITDLLFGIETRTKFDFAHAAKDLRLGARIRDSKGAELSFRRRKNKPALSDLSDRALADDALIPYLGGLQRDVFRRAFGLDAEALRKSSDELKQSDGELGAALFSAASGLRGFNDLRATLDDEADKIFAKTKSQTRAFYQASDRYEKARKDLRDRETRAGALKTLRDDHATQEQLVETIRDKRAAIASEQARLSRLRRAAPVVRAIDAEHARAALLGVLPAAPEGLGAELVAALNALTAAARTQDDADKRAARLTAELEEIGIESALLDRAESIELLQKQSGAYLKALLDLPAVAREEDAAVKSLATLAARLGLPDIATLLAKQPDDASRAHVAECIAIGKRLQIDLAARTAERDRESETLAGKQQDGAKRGPLRDPQPLREQFTALAPISKLAERVEAQRAEIDAEAKRLQDAAARLAPTVSNLDALAQASFPSRETIAAFATSLAALREKIARNEQMRDAAQGEITRLTTAIADRAAGGVVPTRERIEALRSERDAHWGALQATLFHTAQALDSTSLSASVSAFEISKSEADRLADAAALDAHRVAEHANDTRRLADQHKLAQDIETRLAALRASKDATEQEWRALWTAAGIAPLPPAEMAGWRPQADALLERRDRLEQLHANLASAQAQIQTARPAFESLVTDLGLAPMEGLALPLLVSRIDAEVVRVTEIWNAARASDAILGDLKKRLEAATTAAAGAEQAMAVWRETFHAALPRIGLPVSATEVEAEVVLAAWKDVPGEAGRHETLRRRIDGMKRDAATFEREVATLVAEAAPDLAHGDPDLHLREMLNRLTGAREEQARRKELARRIAEANSIAVEAAEARAHADADLTRLAQKMGDAVTSDLDQIARALATRDAIDADIRKRREELANTADGRDEASLRAALTHYDPDTTEADLARMIEEDRALERAAQEAFAAARTAAQSLSALEGAVGAEVAIQQRRNAEAEMVEAARDWAVLSIGAAMIGTAISRQRLGRQEPMMARAGELFALLTGGAFRALGQSYDEVPVLTGSRADGKEIEVTGMSEGTRDQLYLALRLAYVEDYASRAEPPPFIGDDLFSSFDDARTANGLRALAAIGETVQPILFTHHAFLVETAKRELGASVDVVIL